MFTEEQVRIANSKSIMDYLISEGYKPQKIGKNYELKGFGGLQINPNENKWVCFTSTGKIKGGGPVQLIQYLENKEWKEAVSQLLESDSCEIKKQPINENPLPKEKEIVLPRKCKGKSIIMDYLVRIRGIDPDVVLSFLEKKMIYENDKKGCVFVGYNNDKKAAYAAVRGMLSNYKGEVLGSDKGVGFKLMGDNNVLTVVESPIDLLSYITLAKKMGLKEVLENNFLSLGGIAPRALKNFLEENKNITKIQLALDNDSAGYTSALSIAKSLLKQGYKATLVKPPSGKDWNEYLISRNLKDWNEYLISRNLSDKEQTNENVIETKDYFELYAIDSDSKENDTYTIKMLRANNSKIVSVSHVCSGIENVKKELEKIITTSKMKNINFDVVDMKVLERFREVIEKQLEAEICTEI